ncbi:MAG: branched-chain amino acid ABC transporter substrate-binding protein [Spirochaetaceae bacterium]|nr:MAG: branched-chain amino acid ABC transporter substrate-binding protein [Spirochaetaceae bacterium]
MRVSRVVMVLVCLIASIGMVFAGGQRQADTIKIGVAGVHSGDLAPFGLPTVNAARMVADQVNSAGGLLGRQIELVVEDDQCAPDVATNTAAKLLSDGVVAVIGHICSGATSTALAIYEPERLVSISPSSTNPALTDFPNFFRTIAPDDAQAALQVAFAVNELGAQRVALLHDREDYGRGLAEFARDYLQEAGVPVVLFEGITAGAVDYSAIINRVAAENADLVIFGGYHPEASKLVDQMRSRGLNTAFMSGDGIFNDTFIDVAGAAAEGVYSTSPKDTGDNPIALAAIQAHVARFGEEPGAFFMNAYAAAQALFNAIEKAGSTDYDAIIAALRSEAIDTPLGRLTFDEAGNATGVGFSVYQVQGGRFVQVSD